MPVLRHQLWSSRALRLLGEKRDIPIVNGKDLVEGIYFPLCLNFTGVK